jgi:hypothetical protein
MQRSLLLNMSSIATLIKSHQSVSREHLYQLLLIVAGVACSRLVNYVDDLSSKTLLEIADSELCDLVYEELMLIIQSQHPEDMFDIEVEKRALNFAEEWYITIMECLAMWTPDVLGAIYISAKQYGHRMYNDISLIEISARYDVLYIISWDD